MTPDERSFAQLREIDRATKPGGADADWIAASEIYEDRSRKATIASLNRLGVGLRENDQPLEIGLFRRIIDRLAVVYASPATRWLRKTERLSERSKPHKLMTRILQRAQYNLAWSRIDRLRAVHSQEIVRFYPSDARGSVVLRIFEPHNVMRAPAPEAGDQIEADSQFALLLEQNGTSETWEWWRREGETWRMMRVNEKGELTGPQPFASSKLVNPYKALPVQVVYDQLAMGRAWIPPRASRIAWARAINAISNDLWSLVTHQAHSEKVTKTDDPANVPPMTGHGARINLNREDSYEIHTPNPKIAECQQVLEDLAKLWSLSEDLPAAEFDKSKQVLTGAALLVQERSLIARREAQIPLAHEDERIAFAKFRAVHNLHAGSRNKPSAWDLEPLPENVELEVEIGDVRDYIDQAQLQQAAYQDVAAGAMSIIDYIQRRDGVPRHVAIETYNRVQQDRLDYPAAEVAAAAGRQPAKPNDASGDNDATPQAEAAAVDAAKGVPQPTDFAARAKQPSVIEAVRASSKSAV